MLTRRILLSTGLGAFGGPDAAVNKPHVNSVTKSVLESPRSRPSAWSRDRTPADFPLPLAPWKRRLFGGLLRFMMWERRGVKMRWFYLKPDVPSAA